MPTQNILSRLSGVSEARISAGLMTNTVPTSISSISEKTRMTCFTPPPSSRPTISGSDTPPSRIDISAPTKSWTAPAKIVPNTIQSRAAGPNIIPMMAPKIGPIPAMFRNWMRKTFHVGIAM